jgi:drug/metabolite transporter (DMT)-like permease
MTRERQTVAQAIGLIVTSSFAFGSLSTLTVLIGRAGMSLLPAMLWRYVIAGLLLTLLLRRRIATEISRKHAVRLIIVGGFGQALITYLSLRALDFLPVGPLAFLFYTYPAWVALISALFGREDLTLWRIIALGMAMAGITVMVGTPDEPLNPTGVFIALGTAFLYALYLPALNRVQRGVAPAISTFYLILGVAAAFLVGNIMTDSLQFPATTELWGYVAMLSIFSTVIAFTALISGLRVLGPVRTSIIATIEPFCTAMLAIVFLGERPTRGIISGGILIAAAVVILQVKRENRGLLSTRADARIE